MGLLLVSSLVLEPFQRLNSREHYSNNTAPIRHQHLDKEEKCPVGLNLKIFQKNLAATRHPEILP
jgi:hypothetical protein